MIKATINIILEITETAEVHDSLAKKGKTFSEFVHEEVYRMADEIRDDYLPDEDDELAKGKVEVDFQEFL